MHCHYRHEFFRQLVVAFKFGQLFPEAEKILAVKQIFLKYHEIGLYISGAVAVGAQSRAVGFAVNAQSPVVLAAALHLFVDVCKGVKGAEKRVVEKGEGVVFCKLLSAAYLGYALLPCADVKALVFTDYHLVGNALKHLYSIFVRLAVGNHNEPVKAGADIFQHIFDISVGNAVFIVEQENSQSFFSHFYLHYSVNS